MGYHSILHAIRTFRCIVVLKYQLSLIHILVRFFNGPGAIIHLWDIVYGYIDGVVQDGSTPVR